MQKVIAFINQPLVIGLLVVASFIGYEHYTRTSNPVAPTQIDVTKLGSDFAVDIISSHAKSSQAVAVALRSGSKYQDALTANAKAFMDASRAAYASKFKDAIVEIVPEGTEPSTDRQRQALAKFYDDLATGELSRVQ